MTLKESAGSCAGIPPRNRRGGSILAAIMAQFLTAVDRFRAGGDQLLQIDVGRYVSFCVIMSTDPQGAAFALVGGK